MLQHNAQACDIIFNDLFPGEFNNISHLDSAKDIGDTLVEMHGGIESLEESSLMSYKVSLISLVKRPPRCTLG